MAWTQTELDQALGWARARGLDTDQILRLRCPLSGAAIAERNRLITGQYIKAASLGSAHGQIGVLAKMFDLSRQRVVQILDGVPSRGLQRRPFGPWNTPEGFYRYERFESFR